MKGLRPQLLACCATLAGSLPLQLPVSRCPCWAPRLAGPARIAPNKIMMQLDMKEKQSASSRNRSAAGRDGSGANGELAAAGGALASSAVVAEGIQIAGTAVLFYFGQQWSGTDSPVEAVAAMIEYLQQLPGLEGYTLFGATMVFLQVVPIAAAFVLTVSAGAIFGAVKGTATVLTCSTISATISFVLSRTFGRERVLEAAQESKQFRAIDAAFADKPFATSLTLITLLRLSPVLPFSWANYVFGLSPVPLAAFSIGTFVGCLPAVVRIYPLPTAHRMAGLCTSSQLGLAACGESSLSLFSPYALPSPNPHE